ncbi:hypothetical protein SAMN04488029_1383 [Reichenbachiella faecimaris]|uniref:Lipocalin-like domain-containing protein n=1 Tax=Reichenbachiella faecimaris TaxID=692418 RepID=A0A1W2G8K5_REIFA|nr:hypothetical protein [Reichenbachiella faecimaris]SMD33020.1 hypothetical protein SAMN04488029_1383 [Reichenbachiella faecimaris]
MKHFLNFFKYSLFLSLVVAMVSCGGDDDGDEEDTTLADQAELLVQGTATVSSAKLDGNDGDIDWAGFTITFSGNQDGGSYTTNATGNQLLVWPASGTWAFGNDTGTVVTRDNDTDMAFSVGATSLELTFDVDTSGSGRVLVVDGTWVFKFDF